MILTRPVFLLPDLQVPLHVGRAVFLPVGKAVQGLLCRTPFVRCADPFALGIHA